ncbi:hypothetical protein [Flavobacterium sp. 83]|uniref:hypothetical protein n=1 Tax=Flavobacterium sp. 83 TaxID=1131812 RepID=UPI000558BB57|nr:hypothetical protein [Flavobacterium sp. 83]
MFRIRKVSEKKFVVEVLVSKWTLFGLKKEWKPFVKSAGLDCAWHHSTYDFAMMNLLNEVKEQIK